MTQQRTALTRNPATIPVAAFAYAMEWVGPIHNDARFYTWGSCALQAPDGKFHLFGDRVEASRIAASQGHPCYGGTICWGHVHCAEIAHWVADDPEGPYRFADVALPAGREGDIDQSHIYPTVERDGHRWVMLYRGQETRPDADGNYSNARACLAEAQSLDGPWRPLGIVLEQSPDPSHWTHGTHGIHIPRLVKFRGRWHLYFLAGSPWLPDRPHADYLGVAVADRPEGPWQVMETPCILRDGRHVGNYIEDLHPFVCDDRMYLLVDDNLGAVTGVRGGVALFESDDGLVFPFAKARLAVDRIRAYYAGDTSRAVQHWPPPPCHPDDTFKFEAPSVLCINGRPAYFLGSSGTNLAGDPMTTVYMLRIPEWRV